MINASRMHYLALVALMCASPAAAQTAKDSANAARIRAANDSVRNLLARVDSLLTAGLAPPVIPPPVNQKPVARFTTTCAAGACSFSAIGSTDDHAIAAYTWTPDDTTLKSLSGVAISRANSSSVDKTYHETLTVTDSAGLTDAITQGVTIPGVLPIPPPSRVALPEAPRDTVPVTFPVVTGVSRAVHAGDNLQTVLNAAVRGDEIVIDAGAVFTGSFILPAKPGSGMVLIRSSQLGALPAGVRVAPADSAHMPRIVSTAPEPALATATSGAAGGYYLAGLNVTTTCCKDPIRQNGILLLGDGSSAQNTLALMPDNLVLDRVYVHGSPTSNTARCVGYNAGRTAVIDSYLYDCHGKGFDSQAIGGWNGTGPLRVANTMLAGSGENVILGGADPHIPNAIPTDVTFNRVSFFTPVAWKGVWEKKNLFELKNAKRVEVKNSTFSGSWADAQTGVAISLKTSNQSGGCTWCQTTDVWIHDVVVRNAAALVNSAGAPDNAFPVGSPLRRVLLEQIIFEDSIGVGPYTGDARFWLLLGSAGDITVRNVTARSTAGCNSFLTLDKGSTTGATNIAINNNIFGRCTYGLIASSGIGVGALLTVNGVKDFTGNAIIGASNGTYPATTSWVATIAAAEALAGRGANRARVAAAVAGVP